MATDADPTIDDRTLPTDLAENLRIALVLDEVPPTLGEWVDATTRRFADVGVSIGVDELCLTESSRHEARFGDETFRFACVLDTLLVPFVCDETPVAVSSHVPESDAVVEFEVRSDGGSADPDDAVLSFGIAREVSSPGEPAAVLESGYEMVCPYVNAFPNQGQYEEWDASTPEAVTIALSPAEGFALARRLVATLEDGTRRASQTG